MAEQPKPATKQQRTVKRADEPARTPRPEPEHDGNTENDDRGSDTPDAEGGDGWREDVHGPAPADRPGGELGDY